MIQYSYRQKFFNLFEIPASRNDSENKDAIFVSFDLPLAVCAKRGIDHHRIFNKD
jgi:hypothetical protein